MHQERKLQSRHLNCSARLSGEAAFFFLEENLHDL
jgi:hypothetical protein